MNLFLALQPFLNVDGHSPLLGWLITLLIVCVVVSVIVWLVSKVAGPPSIPDPFKWIVWVIVLIALLIFIFAALGVSL